jgi:hypothetical protein
MTIHPDDCRCDTLGCKMRREGLFSLPSAATPTRRRRQPFRRGPRYNSWEAGVAGEHRADGSFMPYLGAAGSPIHVKEYAENRRALDTIRRDQIAGPAEKVS